MVDFKRPMERILAEAIEEFDRAMEEAGFAEQTRENARIHVLRRFAVYFLDGTKPRMNVPPRELRK